ncbi:MAG: hypothetical protein ACN4GG_02340 [Akkermansiaceae bacterium]
MKTVFFLCAFALLFVSCASKETLSIRQFHLTDPEVERDYYDRYDENQFIRGVINKRMHGAITAQECEARKGHYYTVNWQQLTGKEPVKILFEYRQASTGARVKRTSRILPASESGCAEFQIIGSGYKKNGRILSWRFILYEGGQKVASKQSYFWD